MSSQRELSDHIHAEVERLCAEGDELAEAEEFDAALQKYGQAFRLLPEPVEAWEATLWIIVAIGDVHFLRGDYGAALSAFQDAITLPDALGNPFIHLRLGQCQFEAGDTQEAGNELMRAYMGAGPEIFQQEDPKYLRYLSSIARDIDTSSPPSA